MLHVLQTANTPLVEVDARRERFDTMREMLAIDLDARNVGDQTAKNLEMKCVPLRLAAAMLCLSRSRLPGAGAPGR